MRITVQVASAVVSMLILSWVLAVYGWEVWIAAVVVALLATLAGSQERGSRF